jgi:peroxiredoxin Q/BCP
VDRGFVVIGASADGKKAQSNFKTKKSLPFNLLADEEKTVLKAYDAWGMKKFMGRSSEGVLRKTFIIDEEGVVMHIIDKVKTKDHTQQILDLFEEDDEEEDEDEQ